MIVTVEAKGPFGVLAAEDKKWKSFQNRNALKEIQVGKVYDMNMEQLTCEDGKKRFQVTGVKEVPANEIIAAGMLVKEKEHVKQEAQTIAPVKKAFVAKKTTEREGLSFAEKDSRILVQGIVQAVLQSQLVLSLDEVEPAVVKMIDMVKRLSNTK